LPVVEETAVLERIEPLGGEPGAVERRPEAVAGTREVVADRRRIEARVDAAPEDRETGCDHVGNPSPGRRAQLVRARPARNRTAAFGERDASLFLFRRRGAQPNLVLALDHRDGDLVRRAHAPDKETARDDHERLAAPRRTATLPTRPSAPHRRR